MQFPKQNHENITVVINGEQYQQLLQIAEQTGTPVCVQVMKATTKHIEASLKLSAA